MLSRPNTNWNFLFLNIKIEINDNKAEPKNKPKYNKLSSAKTSIPSLLVQRLNKDVNPLETIADNKRYIV